MRFAGLCTKALENLDFLVIFGVVAVACVRGWGVAVVVAVAIVVAGTWLWLWPGGPDDDMNFGRPKKSLKNLTFLIYIFAAQVRDRKSRVQK